MAKRATQAAEAQSEQEQGSGLPPEPAATPESQQPPSERLKFAQEKLAKMESTQKLCFRHQNDLATLEAELRALKYRDFEIDQILEPKGPRNIPGYLKSEIERQRKYVNYLSARIQAPGDSHTATLEQERQSEDELGRFG